MIDFKKEYNRKKELIDDYIKNDLSFSESSYKTVQEAMMYSATAPGKRIRPVMLMAAYEIFGGEIEEILPCCAAIEYIHCYSLIHDDLPAMDNDDLRRGIPTCHKKFGEAEAILAGDALLTRAFLKMTEFKNPYTSDAVAMLARAAGSEGMIGGQIIDIESENKTISLQQLNELHALKTGALIRVALGIGAVLGGASENELSSLLKFGSYTGLAFQIKDDILDAVSDNETLGKPVGSDEKNNKTTYLSFCSIEECEELVKDLSANCIEIAESFGEKGEFLRELTYYLINREK